MLNGRLVNVGILARRTMQMKVEPNLKRGIKEGVSTSLIDRAVFAILVILLTACSYAMYGLRDDHLNFTKNVTPLHFVISAVDDHSSRAVR